MRIRFALVLLCLLTFSVVLLADEIRVRYTEGISRGFLILRTEEGAEIAEGESFQILKNGIVTTHLTFRFDDGSIYEDVATFRQRETFRLLTDHVIEKGPTFPTQLETWLDTATGQVTVNSEKEWQARNREANFTAAARPGEQNAVHDHKEYAVTSTNRRVLSRLTPKPKLIKLAFTLDGKEMIRTGNTPHEAVRFLMKTDIGGIAGAVATITGKKPAETRMWVVTGGAPTFASSEGPLYGEGPVWRIELVSPRRKTKASSQSR